MVVKILTSGSYRGLTEYITHVAAAGPEKDAGFLKGRAGVSRRGRRVSSPVEHVVLSWKAGEEFDREGMTSAARSLLEELGLGDRQCIMADHNYTAHPHLHLEVKRISDIDGRVQTRSLERWRALVLGGAVRTEPGAAIGRPNRVENRRRRETGGGPAVRMPWARRKRDGSPAMPRKGEIEVWRKHYNRHRSMPS